MSIYMPQGPRGLVRLSVEAHFSGALDYVLKVYQEAKRLKLDANVRANTTTGDADDAEVAEVTVSALSSGGNVSGDDLLQRLQGLVSSHGVHPL